jgi:hypothetical protein
LDNSLRRSYNRVCIGVCMGAGGRGVSHVRLP